MSGTKRPPAICTGAAMAVSWEPQSARTDGCVSDLGACGAAAGSVPLRQLARHGAAEGGTLVRAFPDEDLRVGGCAAANAPSSAEAKKGSSKR
eukprot:14942362-Alexandrium_andersonii.AAC.1